MQAWKAMPLPPSGTWDLGFRAAPLQPRIRLQPPALPCPACPSTVASQQYQDWAAVLDLYRHASASLNSRLHSGVLSVSALRPTLYVASNVKYKDFMSSLGLRAQLVDEGRCGGHALRAGVGTAG